MTQHERTLARATEVVFHKLRAEAEAAARAQWEWLCQWRC